MTRQNDITRREFVRCVAGGAAAACLHGCTAPSRRTGSGKSGPAEPRAPRSIDRERFRRLANAAFDATSADHVSVTLHDRIGGLTQFHDDRIADHVDPRARELAATVAFEQQVGSATTTDLTAEAVAAAVKQAEQQARAALPNQEYLPPLPPQRYPVLATYRPETAAADGARRAADAPEVARLYAAAGLGVSGIVASSAEAVGIAANTGLFAFERRTLAELDVTSLGSDVPIRVANANRSIDDLGVLERTRRAAARARWLATPRTLPPGRYTVILEPTAVAQLLRPLLDATDARGDPGRSNTLRDRLGTQIVDPRFTLRNRPDHPALLGNGFDALGLPASARTWIECGVLTRLYYDRRAAREDDVAPTFAPDAWHLSGAEPAGETVEDLIRTTEHGILVAGFDNLRCADAADLMLSGETCNGTFLIDDGEIVGSLPNLKWRESPLRALSAAPAFTTPLDALVSPNAVPIGAVTRGIRKLLVPAIRIRDFAVEG